jgi:hypothetical protein
MRNKRVPIIALAVVIAFLISVFIVKEIHTLQTAIDISETLPTTSKATTTIPFEYRNEHGEISSSTLAFLTFSPDVNVIKRVNKKIETFKISCLDGHAWSDADLRSETESHNFLPYGINSASNLSHTQLVHIWEKRWHAEISSMVTYTSTSLFSQHTKEESYCGGAYTNESDEGHTFDLRTGEEISYQKIFSNYLRDKKKIESLLTLAYVAQLNKNPPYDSYDGGCSPTNPGDDPSVYDSVFDQTTSYYLAPSGIWFIPPQINHASAICAVPTFIPINAIKAYLDPKSPIKNI